MLIHWTATWPSLINPGRKVPGGSWQRRDLLSRSETHRRYRAAVKVERSLLILYNHYRESVPVHFRHQGGLWKYKGAPRTNSQTTAFATNGKCEGGHSNM